MARDDGSLYTGITSTSQRVQGVKEERKETKAAKRAELQPDAHLIIELIEKERQSVPDKVWELTSAQTPADEIKAILGALRLYETYLSNLKNQVSNVLRTKEVQIEGEDEPD